jgi:radical SAM protein with 4Fe4S-binding SPASM domain
MRMKLSAKPAEVVIDTTRRCNLRCIHCKSVYENNHGDYNAIDMTAEIFERVLPVLALYRPTVQLSGHGETLLHPDFMQMVEEVSQAGCPVKFQSNGMLLDPIKIRRLLELGVCSITFSIDAADPELFAKIRRGGRPDGLVENVKEINRTSKQLGKHLSLGFEFVAMRQNIHQLVDVLRLAAELGAEHLQVAQLIEYALTQGQGLANDPLMAEWASKAESEAFRLGVKLRLPPIAHPGVDEIRSPNPGSRWRKACRDPWRSFQLRPNGEIIPCCMILEAFGNLREQSFEEVWFSRQYEELRSSLLSNRPQQNCIDCRYYGWEELADLPSIPHFTALWSQFARWARRIPADPVALSHEDLWWLVLRLGSPDPRSLFRDVARGQHCIADICFKILGSNDISDDNFVTRCYETFLDRPPETAGFEGYRSALSTGTISRLDLVSVFLSSPEFRFGVRSH